MEEGYIVDWKLLRQTPVSIIVLSISRENLCRLANKIVAGSRLLMTGCYLETSCNVRLYAG